MNAVELGIMDVWAGLESEFSAAFPNARRAYLELVSKLKTKYPGAVCVIERDLDRLLRFYTWEERYWPSLRTTHPIERVS